MTLGILPASIFCRAGQYGVIVPYMHGCLFSNLADAEFDWNCSVLWMISSISSNDIAGGIGQMSTNSIIFRSLRT
jgi:hypothetical protein